MNFFLWEFADNYLYPGTRNFICFPNFTLFHYLYATKCVFIIYGSLLLFLFNFTKFLTLIAFCGNEFPDSLEHCVKHFLFINCFNTSESLAAWISCFNEGSRVVSRQMFSRAEGVIGRSPSRKKWFILYFCALFVFHSMWTIPMHREYCKPDLQGKRQIQIL